MRYNKKEIEKQAILMIEEYNLIDIQQVISFLPCSSRWFYNYKMQEMQTIKKAIEESKVKNKNKLFNKWIGSDNPTLQIASYKLMATDEELDRLTSAKFDHGSKDGSMTPKTNIITTMTPKQLKEALKK